MRPLGYLYRSSKPVLGNPGLRLLRRFISNYNPQRYTYNERDDNHITKVFDDSKYFADFNKSTINNFQNLPERLIFNSSPNVGLFKNKYLTTPHGLIEFSKKSLLTAKLLVRQMIAEVHESEEGKLSYIKKLDQLSDVLCRVIDVAEFIRVAHPSQKWINAAQKTHEIMFEYMNQLNTNVDLYLNLKDILEDKKICEKLSDEEIQVGEYLKQDFERSGIHMDPITRNNFVDITQQISLLGSHFNNEIHNLDKFWCEISKDEFNSITDETLKHEIMSLQSKASNKADKNAILVPLAGNIPYTLLLNCESESVRRKIWISLHNSSSEQISTLNDFLKYRAVLSKMLGYKSFSQYQLEHKMAKNPENVVTFLTNLQTSLKSGVVEELKQLYQYKSNYNATATDEEIIKEIKPWDRDYLLGKLQRDRENSNINSPNENISNYLSLGNIMQGLNLLFENIYNIKLIPQPTFKGETWDHNQVRKLKVFDLTKGEILGYLYLDFWSPKVLPSHFTIVCSRKLNTSIGTETVEEMSQVVHLNEAKNAQLPVISLICNFNKPNSSIGRFAGVMDNEKKPTLLTLDQVDTIFHEMGHAMHSMIGKTDLHNLSGTRCSTDFVELPSVLMESFSKHPSVICKIAKHYESGEALSPELLSKYQRQRNLLDKCETFMQSKMAMLDQVLHNEDVVKMLSNPETFGEFDSTKIYHAIESYLQIFADDWSTWHGKFPHLFSYGAVYYSYLLDRAIADKIWNGLFKQDPWSREAGEKYKNSILKWGGTRDPWICLADALSDPRLSKGDSKAMEVIGQDNLL